MSTTSRTSGPPKRVIRTAGMRGGQGVSWRVTEATEFYEYRQSATVLQHGR
jgi:hypothetical protein